jgi:hypothetical protein
LEILDHLDPLVIKVQLVLAVVLGIQDNLDRQGLREQLEQVVCRVVKDQLATKDLLV